MPIGLKQHTWTEDDDLIAFYVSSHGTQALPMGVDDIAKMLGMSKDSLLMRGRNFTSLAGGRALSKAAKQTMRIYEIHRNAPEVELRTQAIRILAARKTR